jgi:SAM-dependent methyltransferase
MSNPYQHSARTTPCDLCEQSVFQRICEQDRKGQRLLTDICSTCGLISHAEIPTDDELARFYARRYRQNYHGEYAPAPYRVIREWSRGRQRLDLLRPFLHETDRTMEVGCGMGATIKQFELAGFAVEGIEPGDGFRQFGIERLRAPIRPGELADLPRSPTYDVVLLVHVLEHLSSPTASLRHIREMLKSGGRLYIEVPNAGAPHAAPGYMFHFAHIYNFTSDTLRMLVEKAGFKTRQWLSPPEDKNLRLLVEPAANTAWKLDRGAFERARQAVTGHSTISYHLRRGYLRERFATMVRHPGSYLFASSRFQQILRRCA